MVPQKEPNTYEKQLVALGRVLQILREEENSDVLIDTVINYLKTEFEYSVIWIGLYDRLEHRLFGKGGVTPTGEISFLKQRFVLNPGDVLEQVMIQQRPVAIPDLREELRAGEWRKAAKKHNIQGTVIFPIRYRDRCYGVTLLGSSAWGVSPKPDEKARLSMILGEFAASLFQIESEWQRQQIRHPDEPLLNLLSQMRSLTGLGPRLEAAVEETHQFIQPTRTSVYWFERERRYFWRRVSNRQRTTGFGEANQPASGITAQEVSGFYQALASDQIVSIGEALSSLKADTTTRLMQQIKARSLLAAPILFQDELQGFLAVEGSEPRIWTEHEKNFIRGAAQIIALTAPLDGVETTIEQIRTDQELVSEIARSIYDEDDWKNTLKRAADQLCKRLKAERFLVLMYDKDLDGYEICYQSHPSNRRPLTTLLENLTKADRKLLKRSPEAIGIENLDGDLKLIGWRDRLLELGIKSLILCNTTIDQDPEGIVVICHEAPRSWNRVERELVRVVSQQLGLILHQWQLQREMEQQQTVTQSIQQGLSVMQQTQELERLKQAALHHLTQVMQAPVAVLVSWMPGHSSARLISSPPPSDRFGVNVDTIVPVHTDFLIQRVLEQPDILALTVQDVPISSRQWLYGAGIGQLLLMALRTTSDAEPSGIVIVVDQPERRWADRHLAAMKVLVNQLAWSRRHIMLMERFVSQRLNLERLSWYKHRRVDEAHRAVVAGLRRLDELNNPKEPLFATRQQQLLRQLKDAIAPLNFMLQEEEWKLQMHPSTISLISLLKRALERVDDRIKQQQLWTQVHDETNLTIGGDIAKIELVLYEILLNACERSPKGGRIDLWCRQIDSRWFELLITDAGHLEPLLLEELESGRKDWLAPSILDHPPGLHLLVCQSLMKTIGGEFNLYRLDDGRNTTRLVLPLATQPPSSTGKAKHKPNEH
ncbi:MAG: GAF domain-containing protein [Oscillatoriales cyanobacterium C42_A2020_001]|nr:GAF domain-containing protein [Leptolyngbyaceae cyanobacterium C42_A2020_001]